MNTAHVTPENTAMYSHRVYYSKLITSGPLADMTFECSFPTTADAVNIHIDEFNAVAGREMCGGYVIIKGSVRAESAI